MALTKVYFGNVEGRDVDLYTIDFPDQLKATITNFGGIITSLFLPDKLGKLENVVLGYDRLDSYINDTSYFGAITGRYCNRIEGTEFSIDGQIYQLSANMGTNHLHGGTKGFNKKVWEVINTVSTKGSVEITLQYVSLDKEEGYPGTLTTTLTYIFTPHNWQISFKATSDKPTVVNLTQYCYFNLSGDINTTILDHLLQINAKSYLPIDRASIPTGEFQPVDGTPFDFTSLKNIGAGINLPDQQLKYGAGYDHCWVLDGHKTNYASRLYHPTSGRQMEVFTTEPGIQFYSGNFIEGVAKDGKSKLIPRSGLCLETQHFPNSPNQPHFPNVVLRPGQEFNSTTTYKFSVK